MKNKQRNHKRPQTRNRSEQLLRNRRLQDDLNKDVKSRYHVQKVLIPICFTIICAIFTFFIFNHPIVKEQLEVLMPKTRYLIYGLICVPNIIMFVFSIMKIKEYFTLNILLEGDNLRVKHFVPMMLNIHDIADMEINRTMLGRLLGYSTVTFFFENRSTYKYEDIINGVTLIRAIKKRKHYKAPAKAPDSLFSNLVGKKIAPMRPPQDSGYPTEGRRRNPQARYSGKR